MASTYAQLGDPVCGIEIACGCQAGAKQKGYQSIELQALLAEATILSQDSTSVDRAIAQLERAAGMAAQLGMRPLSGIAKGALARLLAVSGRKSEAKDELNQAIELFAKSKMTTHMEQKHGPYSFGQMMKQMVPKPDDYPHWDKNSGEISEPVRKHLTDVIGSNLRSAHPLPMVLKAPPLLASLFKVAAALLGGWIILQQQAPRLAWPYGVVSASFVLGAIFIFWPPKRQDGAVSR